MSAVLEHPHKSTTHEEMYFHIKEPIVYKGKEIVAGTVFFRREYNIIRNIYVWNCAVARCSRGDQFSKASGRTIAKRRYFNGGAKTFDTLLLDRPGYEEAVVAYKNT